MSPEEAAEETLETGLHHLSETMELAFLKNVYGGLLLSAGGLLALILACGFPQLTDSNEGLMRVYSKAAHSQSDWSLSTSWEQNCRSSFMRYLWPKTHPGSYTGYPMWLAMTALDGKGTNMQYLLSTLTALVGNFVGALSWAAFQSYFTETVTEEPWRSRIIQQVDNDITDQQWHVISLRSIGCGFLVTIAMLLGTQNRDGISKALGLHLPFFISTTAEFPHTVEYMYLGCTGMMLGARPTVGMFLWKCLLPVILGNSVGGAFTGAYNWYNESDFPISRRRLTLNF